MNATNLKAAPRFRRGKHQTVLIFVTAVRLAAWLVKFACDITMALRGSANLAAQHCDYANVVLTLLNVLSALSVLIEYWNLKKRIQNK
jgi:hypothetical protein